MALADLVVEEAKKWVGYLEKKSNSQLESLTANAGYNNYTIFCKWYLRAHYKRKLYSEFSLNAGTSL